VLRPSLIEVVWSGIMCGIGFATAKEMPKDFEDAKPDLLPVVRSRAYFEINNLELGEEMPPPVAA